VELLVDRPDWWEWELGFEDHVRERMEERGVSELELRAALERAGRLSPARRAGRWLARVHFRRRAWVIVLEPDPTEQIVYVITVYFGD
jgi:hypothetical protein